RWEPALAALAAKRGGVTGVGKKKAAATTPGHLSHGRTGPAAQTRRSAMSAREGRTVPLYHLSHGQRGPGGFALALALTQAPCQSGAVSHLSNRNTLTSKDLLRRIAHCAGSSQGFPSFRRCMRFRRRPPDPRAVASSATTAPRAAAAGR